MERAPLSPHILKSIGLGFIVGVSVGVGHVLRKSAKELWKKAPDSAKYEELLGCVALSVDDATRPDSYQSPNSPDASLNADTHAPTVVESSQSTEDQV
jgi:hypothetical protein